MYAIARVAKALPYLGKWAVAKRGLTLPAKLVLPEGSSLLNLKGIVSKGGYSITPAFLSAVKTIAAVLGLSVAGDALLKWLFSESPEDIMDKDIPEDIRNYICKGGPVPQSLLNMVHEDALLARSGADLGLDNLLEYREAVINISRRLGLSYRDAIGLCLEIRTVIGYSRNVILTDQLIRLMG